MVSVASLAGILVSPVVALLVYADAARRDRPRRLPWAVGVGIVSFGGFLLPSLFGDALRRAYLLRIRSEPVVTSPFEMLVLDLSVGVLASAVAGFAYLVSIIIIWRDSTGR